MKKALPIIIFCLLNGTGPFAQEKPRLIPVGEGWAKNSINTVIFRKNSLSGYKESQYIAYYDAGQNLIVGKRKLGSKTWELKNTGLKARATDAHNSISIVVDGEGFLHIAWNHHNNPLHYVRSVAPGSLQFSSEIPMTGLNEQKLSYPEFYSLPGGDLLFLYRDWHDALPLPAP